MHLPAHKPHSLGRSDGPTVPSDGPTELDLRCDEEMKTPHRQKLMLILVLLSTLALLPTLCFGVRTPQGHQNQQAAATQSGKICFDHGKGWAQEIAPSHGDTLADCHCRKALPSGNNRTKQRRCWIFQEVVSSCNSKCNLLGLRCKGEL